MSINKKLLGDFILSLLPVKELDVVKEMPTFFTLEGYGGLFLDKEEAIQYNSALSSVIDSINLEKISQKQVAKLFQRAILHAIDLEEKQPQIDIETRIKNSIDEFVDLIYSEPTEFFIYYPIEGLQKEGLPFTFGNIEFKVFDEENFKLFEKRVLDSGGDDKELQIRKRALKHFQEKGLFNQVVAKVDFVAVDDEAGKITSLKELLFTIDVFNFYSDLIPYQKGFIYYPGTSNRVVNSKAIFEIEGNRRFSFVWEVEGPLMPIVINQLIEIDKKNNLGLDRVSELLKANRNNFEERLISAMKWAGSATSETDNEKAFLRYVIALETLILFDDNSENISFKLRTRISQVLSDDFETCCRIEDDIKKLYKIRSKIVHDGEYQVSDTDLSLIRFYSKSCILRFLTDNEFDSMVLDDLSEWYRRRIYR